MKLRYKFDKPFLKINPDGKVEYMENRNNTDEEAFLELNLDILFPIYQLFQPNVTDFSDYISKAINKYSQREGQSGSYESIEGKPGIIPASGNDIFNYVARYGMANFQIQAVLKLNGRLDHDKLLKAIKITIDTEPVLGSRFVENQPPYWRRLEDLDKVTFCTFEDTNNPGLAIKSFLESPLSMDNDPMVKLKLISSGSFDYLCIKMNHTCCDGTGVKEYLQLLSDVYTSIDQGNDILISKPNIQSKNDQDRLFNSLGINDPEAIRNSSENIPKTLWAFPWRLGKPDNTRVAICKLPKGCINVMSQYAKARGASINDLVVTAFYRAMFEISKPHPGVPMDIPMTVDLRRYLPDQKTEAIRNFSGSFNVKIARVENESFEGTLSRVVSMLKKIKESQPGLQSAVGLDRVGKDDFHQTNSYYKSLSKLGKLFSGFFPYCSPILSNLGTIDKSLIRFGETDVVNVYIVPPALCAPGILFCIGTYNDEMTLTVSYFESQIHHERMERILDLVKKELMESCKEQKKEDMV